MCNSHILPQLSRRSLLLDQN
jgi:protein transport protein DSL1/ZW10